MSRPIGFSTGSLDAKDPTRALDEARSLGARAIELSALRLEEMAPIGQVLEVSDLTGFEWVSIHAPSRFPEDMECQIAESLERMTGGKLPVVVHPDILADHGVWTSFGDRLLIENMDRRKKFGRLASDFRSIFESLPKARLCLDVAHVRQVDASFVEGFRFLESYGDRLAEIHISDISAASRHSSLSIHSSLLRDFLTLIPDRLPVIIESVLEGTTAEAELRRVADLFEVTARPAVAI